LLGKFKNENRRQILHAAAQTLQAAKRLFPDQTLALAVWQDHLVASGLGPGFQFFTYIPCARIQQEEQASHGVSPLEQRPKMAWKGDADASRAPP
jgi:hypothetical protein